MAKEKTKKQQKLIVPAELSTVTTTSKLLAAIVFISLPFIGFLIGVRYQQFVNKIDNTQSMPYEKPIQSNTVSSPMICTADALLCPNGAYVGRTGPNCEFAPCPSNQ